MITANGLQIGNILEHKFSGKHCRVFGVHINGTIETDEFPTAHHMSAYSPIILTPEILKKCGFEDSGTTIDNHSFDLYRKGSIPLWFNNYDPHSAWVVLYDLGHGAKENHKGFNPQPDIFCLHQLQNLYFALTNTELQYNP